MRWHDADGFSQEAHEVISRHGLRRANVLEFADYYSFEEGVDFNLAPALDFEDAPLGRTLAEMLKRSPAFDQFQGRFDEALGSFDYVTSDLIVVKCLLGGTMEDQGEGAHGWWKEHVERLEGFNVALVRAAWDAPKLNRFILDFVELGNYLRGRWRRIDDGQDRVPTTVGTTNRYLGSAAVAKASYDADVVRDWIQPVRHSPYPRNLATDLEQFGHEKDGHFAAGGEVHLHVRCPIPAREYVKTAILPPPGAGGRR